jgi:hypothetical protein
MLAGTTPTQTQAAQPDKTETSTTTDGPSDNPNGFASDKPTTPSTQIDPSALVRIKRTYNFAGRVHTEEKLVARDSAEAKLYFASNGEEFPQNDEALPAKRGVARRAFRSAFEPASSEPLVQRADLNLGVAARMQAGREAQARKLNTVEKSRMDWAGYVDKEGIKDELELAGKSKESYAARQDFLARSEDKREDEARRARLGVR